MMGIDRVDWDFKVITLPSANYHVTNYFVEIRVIVAAAAL